MRPVGFVDGEASSSRRPEPPFGAVHCGGVALPGMAAAAVQPAAASGSLT
jgi:hypothetical protein